MISNCKLKFENCRTFYGVELGELDGEDEALGVAFGVTFGVVFGVALAELLGLAELEAEGETISEGDGLGLTKITRVSFPLSGSGDTVFCRETNTNAPSPKTNNKTAPIEPNITKSFFRLSDCKFVPNPISFSIMTNIIHDRASKNSYNNIIRMLPAFFIIKSIYH